MEIRYEEPPQSRNEAILDSIINGTEYTDPPQSRIEDLLLQLKAAIEECGGVVDSEISHDSVNPVQNKVIAEALDEKANADGANPNLSAGSLLLMDKVLRTNKTPYLFRPIPPLSTPYIREKLVGASMVWNQLIGSSDTSVTITSGHKYALYKNSTWSVAISDGTAISVTGGTDMAIDLTLAFSPAIADRIYSMEQAQAGSGIAWIKSYGFLNDDYYANDTGSIQSVCVDRKVIKDADDTVETTISLGHDTLRGVMQLDANNNLVYYGDEKANDGVIDRKFGIVDLGSLEWVYDNAFLRFYANLPQMKLTTGARDLSLICSKYVCIDDGRSLSNVPDKSIYNGYSGAPITARIYVHDSAYNDVTAFKTAMSGVYLIYPLATPTTEQSTPFESPQYLFDGGTEEFIDYGVEQEARDVAVPVGHVTEYMGAGEDGEVYTLPPLPEGASGDYTVKLTAQSGIITDIQWVEETAANSDSNSQNDNEQEG